MPASLSLKMKWISPVQREFLSNLLCSTRSIDCHLLSVPLSRAPNFNLLKLSVCTRNRSLLPFECLPFAVSWDFGRQQTLPGPSRDEIVLLTRPALGLLTRACRDKNLLAELLWVIVSVEWYLKAGSARSHLKGTFAAFYANSARYKIMSVTRHDDDTDGPRNWLHKRFRMLARQLKNYVDHSFPISFINRIG